MLTHPQVIIKNNLPEFVVLPYQEYEDLIDLLEDKEDIKAIEDFHAGEQETIPYHLLQDIANGKNAVKIFREFRGISQTQLAKEVGVSRQYICQIEGNERHGSSSLIKKIAKVLDVDLDLLI